MEDWTKRLSVLGTVTRFDYPYMAAGRRRPDRMPTLIDAHRDALDDWGGEPPTVLIGKSMGSRMGCHLSLEEEVAAIVCLGYPLASMGNRDKLRDEVLVAMHTPILFVQGTRDRLCPLDLLAEVRERMTATNALHIVETGDHSLRITKTHTKKTGVTQSDADTEALEAIRAFLAVHAG
jgi:predicted alpha/beta-hydrolase family hydrolase